MNRGAALGAATFVRTFSAGGTFAAFVWLGAGSGTLAGDDMLDWRSAIGTLIVAFGASDRAAGIDPTAVLNWLSKSRAGAVSGLVASGCAPRLGGSDSGLIVTPECSGFGGVDGIGSAGATTDAALGVVTMSAPSSGVGEALSGLSDVMASVFSTSGGGVAAG